jgi:dTDP-4-dehydrorhamnose reductase
MLRLAGEKETLSIINDQHGAPTGAELLADCTAIAIREELRNRAVAGTYHLVASGETSWATTPALCLRWRGRRGRAGD